MDAHLLHAREDSQYRAIGSVERRRQWLLGRTALHQLLPAGTDTGGLTFPHPQLSISHTDEVAFAVQVEHVVGTGVDVELTARRPDPRSARFFLRADERPSELSAAELLRLWTVKEALFKATPDNADLVLLDYRLADAVSTTGRAAGPGGEQLEYASTLVPDGVLTVAVCLAGGPDDAAV